MTAPKPAFSWMEREYLLKMIEPAATFFIGLILALVVRRLLLGWIRRQAKDPKSSAAVFLDTIEFPSILWCCAAAIAIALRFTELTRDQVERAGNWIEAFVIVSLSLVAASAAVRMLTAYAERQQVPFPVVGLSRTLIRVFVLATGAMILLRHVLGYSVTPLLTAFGVTGLAVALALQDTLANFFAGIHILVERPIFIGDLIKLEGGHEGFVTDIGWRTTRVRTGGNDMIVIPNTKITSGILVNRSLPTPRGATEIAVLVGHDANPEQVRRIALDVASQLEGVLHEPAPAFLCDPGVLPTHVQFKLIVHVDNSAHQPGVQSEIRMGLLKRFRAEGVPLPEYQAPLPMKV